MSGGERLRHEASAYLRAHADNPVQWYPWGPAAFAEAQRRDVPIFVSIGYDSCHWCHVMERESFENPRIAKLLNDHFVSIKVDRQELPDVDSVFLEVTQALRRQAGWPMSCFTDSHGRPFFAATYLPPENRGQMAGFPQILQTIAKQWRKKRSDLTEGASQIAAAFDQELRNQRADALLVRSGNATEAATDVTLDAVGQWLSEEANVLLASADREYGGFRPMAPAGTAPAPGGPKFPAPGPLLFLMRSQALLAQQEAEVSEVLNTTLTAMASGGMYDQLNSGFARYSVDERWVVPHFEKMLFDNAQLLEVYATWAAANPLNPRFTQICHELVEFLLRDLAQPTGGFAAAIDAESEGVEGKYYLWRAADFEQLLGEDAAWAQEFFGVTAAGTFQPGSLLADSTGLAGTSVLQWTRQPESEELDTLERVRETLRQARATRLAPRTDDSVLTAWNALTARALLLAGSLLDQPAWIAKGHETLDFLWEHHVREEQDVLRSTHGGQPGSAPGVLEDYVFLAQALLAGAQECQNRQAERAGLLRMRAQSLTAAALHRFSLSEVIDELPAGYWDAQPRAELLFTPQTWTDNPTPSPQVALAQLLLDLAAQVAPSLATELATRGKVQLAEALHRARAQAGTAPINRGQLLLTGLSWYEQELRAAAHDSNQPGGQHG